MADKKKTGVSEGLANICRAVTAVGKDKTNTQQGFKFRGIDAVMDHLHPLFAKEGIVILPEVLEERTEERETRSGGNLIYRILKIRFRFHASDGSELDCTVLGEGMDSGDKATPKCFAIALKYALSQMLLLPYCEVDPDKTTPEPSTPKKKTGQKRKPTLEELQARFVAKVEEYAKHLGDDTVANVMLVHTKDGLNEIDDVNVMRDIIADLEANANKGDENNV